ncbi:DDE-type integrase/transposase/recombinase [Vibrio fluvialis]|uniref:helix-turn-helix domain-containing protein n=1 Tax=Vibrio fluvialis TaxID=676 RepID=UPI001EEBD349|nr:helix-turn-helix domain-containing protein [Vibrio fluvialis]MCG6346544.1 DDE-type integrase/transposase/recombinase [Vibrio fluvialis]
MITMSFTPGNKVLLDNEKLTITQQIDLHRVLTHNESTGEYKTVKISKLAPCLSGEDSEGSNDIHLLPDADWKLAHERFEAIRPILDNPEYRFNRLEMSEIARRNGVSRATLYRWIDRYRATGKVSSLVPETRGVKPGKLKLSDPVNAIINQVLDEHYLSSQKHSISWVCREVKRLCKNAKLEPPHPNTVRNRIHKISEKKQIKFRFGGKAAQQAFSVHRGEFPDGNFPLQVVQIDHTQLDIVLVDDIHRLPIGRPWITLAIDVYSRMVTGFYTSFDPPGALSTGLCLSHSILPKDNWIEKYGSQTDWPLWGVMSTVHADNAKEFRGEMLKRACDEYGIDISWRPVARPHYGAHIERLLGTFNKEIHNLPGTTFSNPVLRKNYDSEKAAALTLSEFERWLTIYITDVYHQRTHKMLGCSPLRQFEKGIFGDEESPGTGLPAKILDERRLRLDFMPFEFRTIQRYGVQIDKCRYYSDILSTYVNAKDPNNKKLKRKFLFRRDPRNISLLYFFDPELNEYFDIPYRDTSHPPVSIWEYREAQKKAEEENADVNEDDIFDAFNRLRAIENNARQETKKVRRNNQRKRSNKQKSAMEGNTQQEKPSLSSMEQSLFENITPFADREVLDD